MMMPMILPDIVNGSFTIFLRRDLWTVADFDGIDRFDREKIGALMIFKFIRKVITPAINWAFFSFRAHDERFLISATCAENFMYKWIRKTMLSKIELMKKIQKWGLFGFAPLELQKSNHFLALSTNEAYSPWTVFWICENLR
jgi:hypothetical protein